MSRLMMDNVCETVNMLRELLGWCKCVGLIMASVLYECAARVEHTCQGLIQGGAQGGKCPPPPKDFSCPPPPST